MQVYDLILYLLIIVGYISLHVLWRKCESHIRLHFADMSKTLRQILSLHLCKLNLPAAALFAFEMNSLRDMGNCGGSPLEDFFLSFSLSFFRLPFFSARLSKARACLISSALLTAGG